MTGFPRPQDSRRNMQKRDDITITSTVFAPADLTGLQGDGDWCFATNLDGDVFFAVAKTQANSLTKYTIAGSVV